MVILPPELVPYSSRRYLEDIDYRTECDAEMFAERRERLIQLFTYFQTND